jgi:uncharacterized protein (DUF58 family)
MSVAMVLEPREFRVLEGLRLNPRKSFPGRVRGERLTKKKGISIEFADYREYAEGDDLRHLDWNVLARLEHPIMKTYRDEEDLAVHLLLDASPSMDFGDPTKLMAASRLACAMGFVGLAGGDAVYPKLLGRKEMPIGALRGRSSYPRIASWAHAVARTESPEIPLPTSNGKASKAMGLATSLRTFINSSARPGLCVLLSDGLDPEAPAALRTLGGRGHEVLFLQILSDIELDPDLEGDLRLLDSESGSPVEITANSYALKEYRRRLEAHNQAIKDAVLRIGGRLAIVRPDQKLEDVLKNTLKREGWVAA